MRAFVSEDSSRTETQSVLKKLLVSSGIEACWRVDDNIAWKEACRDLAYVPVAYTEAMIDYQLAYHRGAGQPLQDVSLVLFHDRHPCGIWPLSFRAGVDEPLGSNGSSILPPLLVRGLSRTTKKALIKACLDFLCRAVTTLCGSRWTSTEFFQDHIGISDWQDQAMRKGARVGLRHDLYVDLSLPLASIKASFRKSYKSLVTAGMRLWQASLLTTADSEVWKEFRTLHRIVAGRDTRSSESWDLQFRAIACGAAFLVCLHDERGRLVGGGLFHVSDHEGTYAVGAYDRSLFEKPLGHVVQYLAIEEMKRRGLRWYLIGSRNYPGDVPAPTPKELSIAEFKQGFATHIFPRYTLCYDCSKQ